MVTMETYPDVFRVLPFCNAHHPQELVDVVSRIPDHTAENNKDIINIQGFHNLVRSTLVRGHGLSHLQGKKRLQ